MVVKDQSEFSANYPTNTTTIAGEYAGSLSNGGELVRLADANGGVVMSVEYEDSGLWPKRADGAGATLELADPMGIPIVFISSTSEDLKPFRQKARDAAI